MGEPDTDALITSLLGGGVAVGIIRLLLSAASAALERGKSRPSWRQDALMDDYEGLVDRLQHQIGILQAEMGRMSGRITTLEASEARLQVELAVARETHKLQLERVYTELEQTRIRLAAVERENAKLRGLMVPDEEVDE